MKRNLTGKLLKATYRVVKHRKLKQLGHVENVFKSFAHRYQEIIKLSEATASHWCCGVTLPPWELIKYYAEVGTRCPQRLREDLADYIGICYRSRKERADLRSALENILDELPAEDAQDIRDYWCTDDLAHMWAVVLWYALCTDYADKFWAA